MARADKGMGGGVAGNRAGPNSHQAPGEPENIISETDLAADKMGDAGQQGTDPDRLTNERDAQANAAVGDGPQADASPVESFEKMNKSVRAERDLNAGEISDHEAKPTESLVDDMSDPEDADASLAARNGI